MRHGDNGVLDISAKNLKLGTASENEADKPRHIKSRAAKAARAAQPKHGNNNKISQIISDTIRADYAERKRINPGKLPHGSILQMQDTYQLSRTNIFDIIKGKIWNVHI